MSCFADLPSTDTKFHGSFSGLSVISQSISTPASSRISPQVASTARHTLNGTLELCPQKNQYRERDGLQEASTQVG